MALLTLKDIGKIYVSESNVTVGIRGVNLSFDRGEFVAITGKSGSGKSTLLNVISGMDSYEEGELFVEGSPTSHYLQPEWEEYREKYDIATARAVAGLPILMEFCVPFVKVGGYFVCLKGPNANLELEESKVAMDVLGVEFIEKINIELPESDLNHNILVFKKVKNTPGKYPRKAGKPVKRPIK